MQIMPIVYDQIGLRGASAFLIVEPEPLLIDTGNPGQAEVILAAMAKDGIAPSDLRHIILTHYDVDHIGSILPIKAATQATVYAHRLDAPCIAGTARRPALKQFSAWLLRAPTLQVDVELEGGETIAGWQVIHTPGHSRGHISLYRPPILIVGDLLRTGESIQEMFGLATQDAKQARESIRSLAKLDFDILLSSHGQPMVDAKPKLQALIDSW